MNEAGRRSFLRKTVQLAATFVITPQLIPMVRAEDSCADPASEALRVSMNYVAKAADAAQSCVTCGFFEQDAAAPACGNCQIMSGPVDAAAFCESWSPKG